jgi:hypothetical protein
LVSNGIRENAGNDPTGRRRLSAEAMLARDEQVAALRARGTSLWGIGVRLGMSLAPVQLAVRRIQMRGVPEGPNLLEMYRGLRGLSGSEQRARVRSSLRPPTSTGGWKEIAPTVRTGAISDLRRSKVGPQWDRSRFRGSQDSLRMSRLSPACFSPIQDS